MSAAFLKHLKQPKRIGGPPFVGLPQDTDLKNNFKKKTVFGPFSIKWNSSESDSREVKVPSLDGRSCNNWASEWSYHDLSSRGRFFFKCYKPIVFNVFDDCLRKIVKTTMVFDNCSVGEVGSQDGPQMGPRRPRNCLSKSIEKPIKN